MEYQIIRTGKAGLVPLTFHATTPADAITEAARLGYAFTCFNANLAQRAELQDQPKFQGLAGPMWGSNAIRYEDTAAYAELSA